MSGNRSRTEGGDDPRTDSGHSATDDLVQRLDQLEAENRAIKAELEEQSSRASLTRRGAMGAMSALGGAALVGGASGTAAADTVLASGTLGTMDGGDPSQVFSTGEITTSETAAISDVAVYVDSSPSWTADYGFNYDWRHRWADVDGDGLRAINVRVQVTWDIDPGAGNDLRLAYEVRG